MNNVTRMHRKEAEAPATVFLTRAELAHELRVSLATVDRMVRDGCPSETWGIRVRRFRLAEVNVWVSRRRAA